MQKNTFKKIISLTYLLIFIFSLFIPFNKSFAEASPIVGSLYADKTTLENNFTTKITATIINTYSKQIPDGSIIKFFTSSSPDVKYNFGKDSILNEAAKEIICKIQNKYCFVFFGASEILEKQTFKINALVYKTEDDINKNYPLAVNITGVEVIVKNPLAIDNKVSKNVATDTTYTPLAPLPGLPGTPFDTLPSDTNPCPFGNYLNIMIKLIIGMAAVLAMVMITMGGVEYMSSELVSGKEAGKETIRNAIFGLLIALGAYLILNTINPQLLSACLDNLPPAEITIEESHESSALFTPISKDKLQALGITCNEKSGGKEKLIEIATSFKDKVIYNQDIRGTISNNKVYLDCSSFIIQVYKCAKLNLPGTYTGNIFNEKNKKKISSGGTKIEGGGNLEIGDLFGWKKGENKQPDGHIMMYAGSGKYIDVHGGTKARAGIGAVGLNRSIKDELIPIINYVIPVKK